MSLSSRHCLIKNLTTLGHMGVNKQLIIFGTSVLFKNTIQIHKYAFGYIFFQWLHFKDTHMTIRFLGNTH